MATKTCSKCGETKDVSEFSKDKGKKDGLRAQCKACIRAYNQANKKKIAEYQRAYKQANKERIAERDRAYRQANKEEISERNRAYHQENKEKIAEKRRAFRQENKEKIAEYRRAYDKKRRDEDPVFAMVGRLRCRLNQALSGQAKPASTMELLGCSREDLMAHLESQFTEGMTWENRSEWHIDHIKPIASFDDPADPACWHYSNLQPLWAEDNIRKGDSWDGEESALEG